MSKFLRKNANPSLLDLLKMDCIIEFNNSCQVRFIGNIKDGYIECYNVFGYIGLYSLDKDGLSQALTDKNIWIDVE